MSETAPAVAPALSTPDTNILEELRPLVDVASLPRQSDDQLRITYEIQRTVDEIRTGRWKRIALQFPDHMLADAPRVFQALSRGLKQARRKGTGSNGDHGVDIAARTNLEGLSKSLEQSTISKGDVEAEETLYILADTSYGACCVDEVAAEHADADVVVHYGRSCLSPTARLPVIYVFTKPPLALDPVIEAFKHTYTDHTQNIILMADIPFSDYLPDLGAHLTKLGYSNLFVTCIKHDTASPLPNRTVPPDVLSDSEALQNYQLFHIADPPASLLLTLSSRVGAIHIYPINTINASATAPPKPLLASSAMTLRRRYALLTQLTTVPIFGILINTLSVKNYLHILTHIKKIIAAAGKKSYTFVVGKVNAAKVANFSEVGGWVVIGCWESSLFESTDFWKPVITPFELELALQGDAERVWTGQWTSDFQAILEAKEAEGTQSIGNDIPVDSEDINDYDGESMDSEEESEPPEFDLRTGRYVSHSRPMGTSSRRSAPVNGDGSLSAGKALIKRANGDLATIGGQVSPAAEFFRNNRTWQGLGSDYEISYDDGESAEQRKGATVEQGRSGIARGYVVGDDVEKH